MVVPHCSAQMMRLSEHTTEIVKKTLTTSGKTVALGLYFQVYSWGFRGEGVSTVRWSEPATFSDFGRHIFRTFRDANIFCGIMKCLVGFPITLKCLTINDLETLLGKNLFSSSFEDEWKYSNTISDEMFAKDSSF